MGDGGWRRVDTAAARHILTRVRLSTFSGGRARGAAGESRPHTKGRRFIGATVFALRSYLSRRRQRGQKPRAALRYSIAVTLRRIRI